MGIESILSGITGITDGGNNTAAEFRDVLTDMTVTLSADTDNHISGGVFNTNNGILSLDLISGSTVNIGLDGRYLTTQTDSQSLSWSVNSGDLEISNGNNINLDGRYALSSDTEILIDHNQVIYVSKAGNDGNSGRNINEPKLTIQGGINEAATLLPTINNQIKVEVLDASKYVEDLTVPQWVHVYGNSVTVDGNINVQDNTICHFKRLINTTLTSNLFNKTIGIGLAKLITDIMVISDASQNGVFVESGLVNVSIGSLIVDAGVGIKAKNGSTISFNIDEVSLFNNGIGIGGDLTGAGNSFSGNILYAKDDGSGRLLVSNVSGDIINIQGGSFLVDELYDIASGGTLNMFVNEYTGNRIIDSGAVANIINLDGNSSLNGLILSNTDVNNITTGSTKTLITKEFFNKQNFDSNLTLNSIEPNNTFTFVGENNVDIFLPLEISVNTAYVIYIINRSTKSDIFVTVNAQGGDNITGTTTINSGEILMIEQSGSGQYSGTLVSSKLSKPAITSTPNNVEPVIWKDGNWDALSLYTDEAHWHYDANITIEDPGAGKLRVNANNLTSVSKFAISSTDLNGIDISYMKILPIGSIVSINEFGDPSKGITFIISTVIDNTSWFEFDVTILGLPPVNFSSDGVNLISHLVNFNAPVNFNDLIINGDDSIGNLIFNNGSGYSERAAFITDISGLTSSLLSKEDTLNRGVINGYAPLDGSGLVPLANLPSLATGGLTIIGFWDADLNSPNLTGTTLNQGEAYYVTVSGSTDLNGIVEWKIGDLAVWDDSLSGNWFKLANTSDVESVFGRKGIIIAQSGDYDASEITETSTEKILTNVERTNISNNVNHTNSTGNVHDLQANQITGGTFNNSVIAESNITQHESALTITEGQISDRKIHTLQYVTDSGNTTTNDIIQLRGRIITPEIEASGGSLFLSQRVKASAFGSLLQISDTISDKSSLSIKVPLTTAGTSKPIIPVIGDETTLVIQSGDTAVFTGNTLMSYVTGTTNMNLSKFIYKFQDAGKEVRIRTIIDTGGPLFDFYGTSADPYFYFTTEAGETELIFNSSIPLQIGAEYSSVIETLDSSPLNMIGDDSGPEFERFVAVVGNSVSEDFLDVDDLTETTTGKIMTDVERGTLNHWEYNPTTDRLEANRSIATNLSTYFLGNRWAMSSGAFNVPFRELQTNTNYFPIWSGIKDQTVVENQDVTGIIKPFARILSDNLIVIENGGPAAISGSTDYADSVVIPVSQSVYGLSTIVEETINPDDVLSYKLYLGTGTTGNLIYRQLLTDITAVAGDVLSWDFTHPLEGPAGTPIYSQIDKLLGGQEGPSSILQVRPVSGNTSLRYASVKIRTYEDVEVSLSGHIHTETDITDLDKYTQNEVDVALSGKSNTGHTHTETDITDLDKYTQNEVDIALSGKSNIGHTHTEYSSTGHTHTESDISDLQDYSITGHTHTVSDITDLPTTFVGSYLGSFNANDALFPSTSPATATSRNGHLLMAFDDTLESHIRFSSVLSSDYNDGDTNFFIDWVAESATSGGVTWGIEVERVEVGVTDIDADSFAPRIITSTTANGTSGVPVRTLITLSKSEADNWELGESFRFILTRVTGNASDTMIGDAQVLSINITQ